jgi:hypothetical protein
MTPYDGDPTDVYIAWKLYIHGDRVYRLYAIYTAAMYIATLLYSYRCICNNIYRLPPLLPRTIESSHNYLFSFPSIQENIIWYPQCCSWPIREIYSYHVKSQISQYNFIYSAIMTDAKNKLTVNIATLFTLRPDVLYHKRGRGTTIKK